MNSEKAIESLISDYILSFNRLIRNMNKQESADAMSVYLDQISTLSERTAKKLRDIDQQPLRLGDNQLQLNFKNRIEKCN